MINMNVSVPQSLDRRAPPLLARHAAKEAPGIKSIPSDILFGSPTLSTRAGQTQHRVPFNDRARMPRDTIGLEHVTLTCIYNY